MQTCVVYVRMYHTHDIADVVGRMDITRRYLRVWLSTAILRIRKMKEMERNWVNNKISILFFRVQ